MVCFAKNIDAGAGGSPDSPGGTPAIFGAQSLAQGTETVTIPQVSPLRGDGRDIIQVINFHPSALD